MKRLRSIGFALTVGLLGAGGCKQILSIDDAELDPSLTAGSSSGGNAGSSGGSGGSGGTGGSSGGGGADGQAGSEGGDAETGTLCERYCTTVFKNCAGDQRVYDDISVCLATCPALPEGQPGDRTGNSVYCRLFAAQQAGIFEPAFNCSAAGPGGDGKCGTNCEGLCTIGQALCVGVEDVVWYPTPAACLTACAKVFDPGEGKFTVKTAVGPTVQCRLYHVSNATFGAGDHCPHALGESPCDNPDGG